MEEDEEIKIKKNNEADYNDFSLNDMKKEIENLEEKLAYLRNLSQGISIRKINISNPMRPVINITLYSYHGY